MPLAIVQIVLTLPPAPINSAAGGKRHKRQQKRVLDQILALFLAYERDQPIQ